MIDGQTQNMRGSFIKYIKHQLIDRIDNHTYIHKNVHDLSMFSHDAKFDPLDR